MKQTSADINCLVRAHSEVDAFDKLKHQLQKYEIYDEKFARRIIPICGDLSSPQLGLSTEQFGFLADHVDVIYHNGAFVNFTKSYTALKDTNVLGTQEILRMACMRKTIPVHYVSTLSVFSEELPENHMGFAENDALDEKAKLSNGYSQSKWVAERLMNTCAKRGLPITIYRPATVTGDSQTGVWNTDDFLCRMIRGCIALGKAPEKQVSFNVVPVDYVSKAIVALSRNPDAIGNIFHLSNSSTVSSLDIVGWINTAGYPVKLEPYSQWRKNMLAEVSQAAKHPLYPLMHLFESDVNESEESLDDPMRYRSDRTRETLALSGIQCPFPSSLLFKTYVEYLQKTDAFARN
jgi:thioester reductase-like protein